jgi:hypothetical protein
MRSNLYILAAVALISVLGATPAMACRGVFAESYFISPAKPEVVQTNTIILEIRIAQKPDPFARFWAGKPITADVIAVVQGLYTPRKATLLFPTGLSSCDRLAPMADQRAPIHGFVVGSLEKGPAGTTHFVPQSLRPVPSQSR